MLHARFPCRHLSHSRRGPFKLPEVRWTCASVRADNPIRAAAHSHARNTSPRKRRNFGCTRFSAYLDQYMTSIAQLRLYIQYEIISHARTTSLRKIRKLSCARFGAYLDQYITPIAQLRLYMQYEIISHARIKLGCARCARTTDTFFNAFLVRHKSCALRARHVEICIGVLAQVNPRPQ